MSGLMKFITSALRIGSEPKAKPKPAATRMAIQSGAPLAAMRENRDIVGGLVFCATMQPRIPLRVLDRHGEVFSAPRGKPPAIAKSLHEGIWIPLLHGQRSLCGSMASSVGPIPADGGEFLPFLIAIRRIVEADASVEDRIRSLSSELGRQQWANFIEKLEPIPGDLVRQFFPRAVDTIPGLAQAARDSLEAAGLDTAAKIAAAPDADLLAIKGIGKAKIEAMRKWQKSKIDRNAARLDLVDR